MSQHQNIKKKKKHENEWGILVIGPVVQSLLLGGMVQSGFKNPLDFSAPISRNAQPVFFSS